MFGNLTSKKHLLDMARTVQDRCGKSLRSQLLDIARLRRSIGGVQASEYYAFRLYDDRHYPWHRKLEFLGWRADSRISAAVNSPSWDMVEEDKVMGYAVAQGLMIPSPRIYAIYHRDGRVFPGASTLRNPGEVAGFLRGGMTYPFFAKPAHSNLGQGALAVNSWVRTTDSLLLASGEAVPVESFVSGLDQVGTRSTLKHGYIFQEMLRPHPVIDEVTGGVAGIRAVLLREKDGPRLFRAVWKVLRKGNMTDNFNHGKSGNLLAAVNVSDGVVERAVSGTGPGQSVVDVHPDSGKALRGVKIPDWNQLVELGQRVSASLPRIPLLHLDIVPSDRGPILLEINIEGNFDLLQIATGAGAYDDELRAFLSRHALEPRERAVHEREDRRIARLRHG